MGEFLTKDQLKALQGHTYKSEGKSFLDRLFLAKFWDRSIEYFPITWSPNFLTLLGVAFMIVPFFFLVVANPDAKSDNVPSWVQYAMAFGLFAFQFLDNLDGRQARRTGSSTALGEFFDHGCDTISDPCMGFSVIMALQIGERLDLFFVMGLLIIQDYCFYWRAHWSGKYVFGDVDVSEIQFVIIAILTITGLTGQSLWEMTVFGLFEVKTPLIMFYFGFAIYYLGDVWFDAIKIGIFNRGEFDPETRRNVLAPMNSLLIAIALTVFSRYFSDGIYEKYPVPFLLVYILVVAKLSCRLLVANMTRTRMVTFDSGMFAFFFLLLSNRNWTPAVIQLSPSSALFVAAVFAAVDFLKFSISISSQLADHFDVYCLSFGKPAMMKRTSD